MKRKRGVVDVTESYFEIMISILQYYELLVIVSPPLYFFYYLEPQAR